MKFNPTHPVVLRELVAAYANAEWHIGAPFEDAKVIGEIDLHHPDCQVWARYMHQDVIDIMNGGEHEQQCINYDVFVSMDEYKRHLTIQENSAAAKHR